VHDRIVSLKANEQQQVRGNLKRVIVRRASGPVLIETDKSEVIEARQGDNVLFENVCSVMSLTDKTGMANRLWLVLVSDGEGDVSSVAATVDLANAGDLTAASPDYEIRNYTSTAAGVKILDAASNRRAAIISTDGLTKVGKTQGAADLFTVDGVLEHTAQGDLWAHGEGVEIEVLEYLN